MKDISSTLLLHLEKYAHVISFHMQYITQFQYIPLFMKCDNVLYEPIENEVKKLLDKNKVTPIYY